MHAPQHETRPVKSPFAMLVPLSISKQQASTACSAGRWGALIEHRVVLGAPGASKPPILFYDCFWQARSGTRGSTWKAQGAASLNAAKEAARLRRANAAAPMKADDLLALKVRGLSSKTPDERNTRGKGHALLMALFSSEDLNEIKATLLHFLDRPEAKEM